MNNSNRNFFMAALCVVTMIIMLISKSKSKYKSKFKKMENEPSFTVENNPIKKITEDVNFYEKLYKATTNSYVKDMISDILLCLKNALNEYQMIELDKPELDNPDRRYQK